MKQLALGLLVFFYTGLAVPQIWTWEPFKLPQNQFDCLVTTLYHEARGEPAEGVLAVAKVVLNRMESPRYPKSVCGVVKQQLVRGIWQFSFWKEKHLLTQPVDKESWKKMQKIAQQAVNLHYAGFDVIDNSMYYYNPDVANPKWAKSKKLKFVRKIGKHKFYKRVKN